MIGMIPGNGHPYSWSAILNGYDKAALQKCPYSIIPEYMSQQDETSAGLEGATVTHIWTDDPCDAPQVAAATRIGTILERPEDAIGAVDAAIIATDDGDHHVERARPFIEAGIPVFIDKPLATNVEALKWFMQKEEEGCFFMSSSGLRYAPELASLKRDFNRMGEMCHITGVTIKKWETYGIHALESVFQLTGPGIQGVCAREFDAMIISNFQHRRGFSISIPVMKDVYASFGTIVLSGKFGSVNGRLADTYTAFKDQLAAFLASIRRGKPDFPFSETVELMAAIIAGRVSIAEKGRYVPLTEILTEYENGPC